MYILVFIWGRCGCESYYYYYYLIKFNVRIEPLGYGSLVELLHSTVVTILYVLYKVKVCTKYLGT